MRKVIVSTYITQDGRVDDIRAWAIAFNDDRAIRYQSDLLSNSDGLLLGRKTYEDFASLWPQLKGKYPHIDKFNTMPKYVASTTLKSLSWENSHLIEGDAVEGVAALKQQPGQDLILYGCHGFTHSLMEHDLIDEYRFLVHPVLFAKGRSFLKDGMQRVNLNLVDTTALGGGVTVLTYQPAR